ncbi:MAG: polyphenol oxidase family protein [Chthoniobacterales bacterium]
MARDQLPIERFSALSAISNCQHGFVGRLPGIEVASDKAEALRRLDAVHGDARRLLGVGQLPFITAEQVHGREVAVIDAPVQNDRVFAACDGFVSNQPGVLLGIYVADCAAVYIVDPIRRAFALVHSGRKGTELGIAGVAIDLLAQRFASESRDLVVQVSPCIRPPHYETDFAAEIVRQCRERGVCQVYDAGICTACQPESYYSYRAEKGRTGRMLALLSMADDASLR